MRRRRLALSRHDLHARLAAIDVEGGDGPTVRSPAQLRPDEPGPGSR